MFIKSLFCSYTLHVSSLRSCTMYLSLQVSTPTCEIMNLPFHALGADASTLLSLYLVHLVDIWNVIEALRENALNNVDPNMELSVARLEAVLSTIFYQLNKRMPTTHQIQVEQSISLLLNFLLAAFDP